MGELGHLDHPSAVWKPLSSDPRVQIPALVIRFLSSDIEAKIVVVGSSMHTMLLCPLWSLLGFSLWLLLTWSD